MSKKVLFVATVDSHIELFHLPYLKMFKERGYDVHVATDSDKKIKYCDKKIKLPIKRNPLSFVNLKAILELKKVLKKESYEIIHCHTPMGGVVARLAARKMRKTGTRVIYTAHGFHFYKGAPVLNWMLYYLVEKWLSKYTDTLITINTEDFERAKRKFGKRCFDIQYVPGVGVDQKKFEKRLNKKEKTALRKSLGLKDDDKVLIFSAELSKRKNQIWLIETLEPIFRNDKQYRLLLPGKDSMKGKCQTIVKKLNLEKQIHFLGFRDDIMELLQVSDIAVSSAKQEGLPVNLIEAAMAGLPIVATDCRGNRDVCENCGGKVVKIGDMDSFVKMIAECPVEKNKTVPLDYSFENVSKDMEKIYFRKKRVLHLLASNSFSGAENVACTIINNLSDEFEMAYCSPSGPIEEVLTKNGIQFYAMNKMSLKILREIIKKFNPDIIHAHDYTASVKVAFVGFDGMIVSHLHNNNPFAKYWNPKTILYAKCSKNFNQILGVSDKVLSEAIFKRWIKNKYKTIYNLVDADKIIVAAKAKTNTKKYDLGFFGRLSRPKDPLTYVKIVALLKKQNPKIKACMIGDGELFDKCKTLILELDLENNVDMLGFLENPFPVIQDCNKIVMPSKWEGFGLAAVESLILSKPVFNSGAGGLAEIFAGNQYFICEGVNEYVKKITEDLKISDTVFAKIVAKYTDKKAWKNLMISVYNTTKGGQ